MIPWEYVLLHDGGAVVRNISMARWQWVVHENDTTGKVWVEKRLLVQLPSNLE